LSAKPTPGRDRAGRVRPLLLALAAVAGAGATAWLFGHVALTSLDTVLRPSPDSPADLLVLVLAGAGALLAAWLGLGFTMAALAALPGTIGAAFDVAASRVAPTAVRRIVALLLGTALTATLVPSPAGAAGALSAGHRGAACGSSSVSDPGMPPPAAGAPDPAFRQTSPAPSAAVGGSAPPPAPDPSFRPTVGAGVAKPDRTAYTPQAPAPPSAPRGLGPLDKAPRAGTSVEENVVVRRGDTLWHIAARYLGPGATTAEIAHEWPRWHAANRAVIGDDPDLIHPGQLLTPPTSDLR
jgi:nucleoid-associated protein YgaU